MNKYLVAKSYKDLPTVGEEYTLNNKTYIKVRMKSGELKQVRTYTQKEYTKLYPEVKIIQEAQPRKNVLGFGDQGFIWLFRGNTYDNLSFFQASPCRYARVWGWYLPSDIEMPDPLPVDITPVKLTWDEVSFNDKLIPEDQIVQVVDQLLYDEGTSRHIGQIGDRVEFDGICTYASETQTMYGINHFFIFESDEGDIYTWSTSSRMLIKGQRYHVRGTIKGHDVYRNRKQNAMHRCKVEEI